MNATPFFDYTSVDRLIALDRSFILFRSPFCKEPELAVFKPEYIDFFDNIRSLNGKEGFVMAPFFPTEKHPVILLKNPQWLTGETSIFRYLSSIKDSVSRQQIRLPFQKKDREPAPVEPKTAYKSAFHKLQNQLKTGYCDKVVLSRIAIIPKMTGFSAGKTFKSACRAYPEAFVYLCHNPVAGTWIGSTPEMLLSGDHSNWQTVALAGTKKQTDTLAYQDWDDKNKQEQKIVSSYIENIIRSNGYQFSKTAPQSVKAGELAHLKTVFNFQMNEPFQLGDLLDQLHPTPAVCGFPKDKARQLIMENEGYDRAYYGGFVGALSVEGKTGLFVNIRCLSINKETLTFYAGGGLLVSSIIETEWEETEAKLKTMRSLIDF